MKEWLWTGQNSFIMHYLAFSQKVQYHGLVKNSTIFTWLYNVCRIPFPGQVELSEHIFKKILFYWLSERGEEKGERERSINVWLPLACPLVETWLQSRHAPWDLNWQLFGLQIGNQSTELHQAEISFFFKTGCKSLCFLWYTFSVAQLFL